MSSQFRILRVDLDDELFVRRNIRLARFALLGVLAHNDTAYQTHILEQVSAEHFGGGFEQYLFETMLQMRETERQVDIERLRQQLPAFAPHSTDFIQGCLANFEQMLGLSPTKALVDRAIEIMVSPPPPQAEIKPLPDDYWDDPFWNDNDD